MQSNSTRREFLKKGSALVGAGLVAGCAAESAGPAPSGGGGGNAGRPPNILLVLVDQFRTPPDGYRPNQGEAQGVREVFRFDALSPNNQFARFFPGLLRLRKNAVVMRRHYIASAACAPSRTTFITGQYPSLHGVTQVDGIFKGADEIRFLDPSTVPTVGDWFQAAGYDSYYFGKWHVSHVEQPYDLGPWGFAGWQTSGPEPHGSDPDNLGAHRDPQFSDIVQNFFQTRAQDKTQKPWFAVASLVNPHDIAAYPFPFYLPGTAGVTQPVNPINQPQDIPPQGRISNPDANGRTVPLNPDGFPQNCFGLPPTFQEDLSQKPQCHLDSAWKVQIGLRSQFPNIAQPLLPYPLQRQNPPGPWSLAYGQFYVYLQYLVDLELQKIFQSFDQAGLDRDTIVVFTSDHGEMGMAHGQMLQKWHTAYEEIVRVPFVVSSPLVNASADQMREVTQPTSHIDLAPTLLGLAGFSGDALAQLQTRIQGHTVVRPFVGQNLAPLLVQAGGQQLSRPGVLFTTDDKATTLPDGVANPEKQAQFDDFVNDVNTQIRLGAPLAPGPVLEPNSVHMLCTGVWKLNRYIDPSGVAADQWELYHLPSDPNESTNLVDFRTGNLRPGAAVPGLTPAQLQAELARLRQDLTQQENALLLTA